MSLLYGHQIIRGKPRALLRRLKLSYKSLRKTMAGKRDIVDQYIPLQAVNRTIFEYKLTWFGEDEFYAFNGEQENQYASYPKLRAHLIAKVFPKSYIFNVKDARISLDSDDVIDPKNPSRFFVELYCYLTPPRSNKWNYKRHKREYILAGRGRSADFINSAFVFSPMKSSNNYFHFVIDGCARFVDLDEQGFLEGLSLLHSQPPNAWQAEYLRLLGMREPFKVLPPATAGDFLSVGSLLISSPTRHQYLASRRALHRLRNRVFDGVGGVAAAGKRNLYISRRDAANRRVLNEADVEALLTRKGFEVVTLSGMSVCDQVRLFRDAKTIVAPHGAGLTNMIYADRARIIELLPGDGWDLGYFISLARTLGHEHCPVISDDNHGDGPEETGRHLQGKDFTVNLKELEEMIR